MYRFLSGRRYGLWLCMGLCIALGMLSGYLAGSGHTSWYVHLRKPWFQPPSWIFAPVWTVLYGAMGYVLWGLVRWHSHQRVLQTLWQSYTLCAPSGLQDKKPPREIFLAGRLLAVFGMQMALNFSWSFMFFYLHRPLWAFWNVLCLWVALVYMWQALWHAHTRGLFWAWSPYVAWVSFASILNGAIVVLNKV